MELRHLRTFLTVAETAHVGRAAKRLHVSQPAVSQQLRELEEELGLPLFERHPRGVRLTRAGETFRAHASRAVEDVRAGARAIEALAKKDAGELRVAYLPSTTADLVTPALAAVMRRHPNVRVVAYEGTSRRVERLVAEGLADVGLGLLPVRRSDLVTEPLAEGHVALVLPARHPLARADGALSLREAAGEPFALLARPLRARAFADAAFARANVEPRVVLEADAVATVLAAVRAGLALSLLPAPRAPSPDLVVRPLRPRPAPHVVALFTRPASTPSPLVAAFTAEVRTRAATP